MLRTRTNLLLEVFSESRLSREVQPVGYLLYRQVGIPEHHFCFQNYKLINPLQWPLPAISFDSIIDSAHLEE